MNLIDVMSRISGQTPEQVRQIWGEVKVNRALLDSCPGPHKFESADRQMVCSLCGGRVDPVNAAWYERGMVHALRLGAE